MLKVIKELREKMARLLNQARTKLDEITDDTNETRAVELEAEYDAIMVEHDELEAKVRRRLRKPRLLPNDWCRKFARADIY